MSWKQRKSDTPDWSTVEYYWYKGKKLPIARYADIPHTMRPYGKYAKFVQRLLHTVKPWSYGDFPIETERYPETILPMALPTGYAEVVWGVHRGHKAMKPGLSPFVERGVPHELTGLITVELIGSSDNPLLVRAYGGDYTPPLPWMKSVDDAPGGKQESLDYWRSHAYLMRNRSIIREGTETTTAPDWFTPSAVGSGMDICNCSCERCAQQDHCHRRHAACRM